MAALDNTTHLILHGGDAPTEVDVQPQRFDQSLSALFFRVQLKDSRLVISGNPEDVRAFLNNALDAVDEAMEPLTMCQRRGKHNWEPSGPEDGCTECSQESLAAPVLVRNGAPF